MAQRDGRIDGAAVKRVYGRSLGARNPRLNRCLRSMI
jgi:hypothetical protein